MAVVRLWETRQMNSMSNLLASSLSMSSHHLHEICGFEKKVSPSGHMNTANQTSYKNPA